MPGSQMQSVGCRRDSHRPYMHPPIWQHDRRLNTEKRSKISYATSSEELPSSHDDRPHGLLRWLTATKHKYICTHYLFLAATTCLVAVSLSIVMRLELQ